MINEKRNPPTAATVERAKEPGAACRQATNSHDNNFIIRPGAEQAGIIAGLLLYGSENGLTLQDLRRITDWPERTIRKEIEAERRAGALIISNNRDGYYLSDDPSEAARFVRSMKHRAAQIRRTAAAIEKAAGLL